MAPTPLPANRQRPQPRTYGIIWFPFFLPGGSGAPPATGLRRRVRRRARHPQPLGLVESPIRWVVCCRASQARRLCSHRQSPHQRRHQPRERWVTSDGGACKHRQPRAVWRRPRRRAPLAARVPCSGHRTLAIGGDAVGGVFEPVAPGTVSRASYHQQAFLGSSPVVKCTASNLRHADDRTKVTSPLLRRSASSMRSGIGWRFCNCWPISR